MHAGGGCCVGYGAVWINSGAGYLVFVFNDLATGITPRGQDGTFFVSSKGGRIRFSESNGSWAAAYEANPGPANGINSSGEITGHIPKRGLSLEGQPYLLLGNGTLVKLPVSKGGIGSGLAVTEDRWVAGYVEIDAVVWRPDN